jgi:hypothetical protein
MEIARYKVRVTFLTPVLGAQPTKDVATEYLGSKFVDNGGVIPEEELESLPETIEKGTTVFHKIDGLPVFWDYQIKGFLKEAGRTFNGLQNVKALRSKIDNFVFVKPRKIEINMSEGSEIEFLERPLRAETAQGPRVALARSEMIKEGAWLEFYIEIFKGQVTDDIIRELMTYGEYKGIGQWRNGGYGRFTFEFIE